jgi:hypothetical protein
MNQIAIRNDLKNLKILYFADLDQPWSNSSKHWEIITKLCPQSISINWGKLTNLGQRKIFRRFDNNPFKKENLEELQLLITNSAFKEKPHVIWFEKPLMVLEATLHEIKHKLPSTLLVSRQDDNPFGLRRKESAFWKIFINAIPFYDFHYVKRDGDILKFHSLGAKEVHFYWVGYDTQFFSARSNYSIQKDLDFSFIGTNLDNRSSFFLKLAKKLGTKKFIVAGAGWNRSLLKFCYPSQVKSKTLTDEQVRNIFDRSHACIGLFCESNMDEFSGRAFMIAGSGSCLVAPKTKMHSFFFKENHEALFFENIDECASHINHLKNNPLLAQQISVAASSRSLQDGYAIESRVKNVLLQLFTASKIQS